MKRQDKVFLMDGDALIIPQKRLVWILDKISEHLPWVKRVGAYANTKGIKMKSPEELEELHEKGLGISFWVWKPEMMRFEKRSTKALAQRTALKWEEKSSIRRTL